MDKYWAGTPNYTPGNYGIVALFPHWTCGGFDGSVATLQNPDRQASAHYVIEGDRVAQLVDESDSAWHCGNYYYNMRAISYELVGWTGNPPSYATLDTCAELMAQASRDYFDGAPLVLGENVMLHKWVADTDCPGETDIDYLVAKANEILNGGEVKEDKVKYCDNWGGDVYRLYNPYTPGPAHFYAKDGDERNGLLDNGWCDEGIAFTAPRGGVLPVYRMHNPGNGDHIYTVDFNEAASIDDAGWQYEGIPFFANEDGKEVYRLYNPNSGEHFYTADGSERSSLASGGWNDEGIAFHI